MKINGLALELLRRIKKKGCELGDVEAGSR